MENSAAATATFDSSIGRPYHFIVRSKKDGRTVLDSAPAVQKMIQELPVSEEEKEAIRREGRELAGGGGSEQTYNVPLNPGTYEVLLLTYPPEIQAGPVTVTVP